MQYYSKLRDHMSLINTDKLCDWFTSARIISHNDITINKGAFMMYGPEIVLTKMISQILTRTSTLYIMFETLRNHSDIFYDLLSEIQVALDQKLLTGM